MQRDTERQTTFREVFADRQFRALFGALGLSTVGDFLARGAVTLSVYVESGSATLTAITYALTFLPDLVGGPLLSGLADRFPRRTVMIVSDIGRAALVVVMATVALPLPALWVVFSAVRLLDIPFRGAHTATLSSVLSGDRYVVGTAICTMTANLGLGIGFALSGAVIGLFDVSAALAMNAATFVCSALLVAVGVEHRPAVWNPEGSTPRRWSAQLRESVRLVRADSKLRTLMMFAVVPGTCMVVTSLAGPYTVQIGAGPTSAGVLMATAAIGMVAGVWVLTRYVAPATRMRLIGPLAAASCAPLMVVAWQPNVVITVVLWFVNGAATCFWVPVAASVVARVPDANRGQINGLLTTVLRVFQGIGVLSYGPLSDATSPATAIASAAVVGLLVATFVAVVWRRVSTSAATDTGFDVGK